MGLLCDGMVKDGLDHERRLFRGPLEPVFPVYVGHSKSRLVTKDPLEVAVTIQVWVICSVSQPLIDYSKASDSLEQRPPKVTRQIHPVIPDSFDHLLQVRVKVHLSVRILEYGVQGGKVSLVFDGETVFGDDDRYVTGLGVPFVEVSHEFAETPGDWYEAMRDGQSELI